jgi:hypothetical protein
MKAPANAGAFLHLGSGRYLWRSTIRAAHSATSHTGTIVSRNGRTVSLAECD